MLRFHQQWVPTSKYVSMFMFWGYWDLLYEIKFHSHAIARLSL